MKKNSNFLIKQTDRFLLLIVFFALLLSSLFIYLLKIDREVINYGIYQQKLQNISALDLKIENYTMRPFRFINNDDIVKISQEFERSINFLKNSGLKSEFGKSSYDALLKIEKLYKKKIDLLERFQSPNSRATNAIHYLYDLRRTIEKEYPNRHVEHRELDQILFGLGRVLMGMPLDKKSLDNRLNVLKSYNIQSDYFDYFYRQTEQFMVDAKLIKKDLAAIGKIDLLDSIEDMMLDLTNTYNQNRFQQQFITFSFFILAFLILIILSLNYRRVRQTSLELMAFRYAIENSDNTVVITDKDRKIEYVNEAFEINSGYKRGEVIGKNPSILKSGLHGEEFYREMNTTLDRGDRWQGELINSRQNGDLVYEKASITPIVVNNKIEQYLAIKLNITEYIETQHRLQQSAAVYEMIGDGIAIMDSQRKINSVNPSFVRMFGYSEGELIGKDIMIVNSPDQDINFYQTIWMKLKTRDQWRGRSDNQTKSGKSIPVLMTITVVKDNKGEIQNYIATFTNLEEIIEMEEKANFLAYHDTLTMLPNRVHIETELVDIVEVAKVERQKVAIFLIDLDRFKVINDSLGHNIGDEMLIILAKRLKDAIGSSALLARSGGDEFAVVMNDIKDKQSVTHMAEKILTTIRETIVVRNYNLNTTASIGIAFFPDDGEDMSMLVKNADSAMYYAKERGKDNYKFYREVLSIDINARLDMEQKLLHAIEREELSVVYQPQYNMQNGEVCGVEALVRWSSEELGEVSPEKFISIAEETGMIVKIGYFVLEESCKAYMNWKAEGIDLDWVAINLSSVQFRQDDLVKNFTEIMQKTGISPHNLEMEITERFMLEHTEGNLSILDEFRSMGCSISIDDFGTGYSSMSYLKSLSIDKIKIDKSFIEHLSTSKSDQEVSRAIIALSHSLGYQVVAEGIETKAEEDFLKVNGCDFGQGFYFSRPLHSEALIEFIKSPDSNSKMQYTLK